MENAPLRKIRAFERHLNPAFFSIDTQQDKNRLFNRPSEMPTAMQAWNAQENDQHTHWLRDSGAGHKAPITMAPAKQSSLVYSREARGCLSDIRIPRLTVQHSQIP